MSELPEAYSAWLENPNGARVPIRDSCSLGRSASNHVPLNNERVSRRHALIQAQQLNEFWLVDFGSSNGTYLNGRRLAQPTRLYSKDQIQIGPFQFTFYQTGSLPPLRRDTVQTSATVAEIQSMACWLLVADIINSSQLFRELPPNELPVITGQWLSRCKQIIETTGGRINPFLGDGFFAYWSQRNTSPRALGETLLELGQLQEHSRPAFRWVMHYGQVTFGGLALGEEERISGTEVHFVFRMEKLAKTLDTTRLLSEAAVSKVTFPTATARALGSHPLPGFECPFVFYTL